MKLLFFIFTRQSSTEDTIRARDWTNGSVSALRLFDECKLTTAGCDFAYSGRMLG